MNLYLERKLLRKLFKHLKLSECIMEHIKFRIVIEQDENGMFVAECPTLPGCISQGKTNEEAIRNIKDAIQGYVESLKKHNEPIPPSIQEAVVEVCA